MTPQLSNQRITVTESQGKILDHFKAKARFSQRSFYIAHEVGLIGYETLKAGQGKDFRQIEPLYLRKSQAEEKH